MDSPPGTVTSMTVTPPGMVVPAEAAEAGMSHTSVFLICSATVNVLVLSVILTAFLLRRLFEWRTRSTGLTKLQEVIVSSPLVLPSIFIDQILTLLLLAGSLYVLCGTSLLRHPFKCDALPPHDATAILVLLSVNTGRYMFKLGFRLTPLATRGQQDSLLWVDVLHHAVVISCFLVLLIARENWITGVIAILMDGDVIFFEATKVMKTMGHTGEHRSYFALTSAGLGVGVLSRCGLPLALLTVACVHQSPLLMSPIALSSFFLSAIFLTIVNIWLIRSSFISLRKSRDAQGEKTRTRQYENHLTTVFIDNCNANRNRAELPSQMVVRPKLSHAPLPFVKNDLGSSVSRVMSGVKAVTNSNVDRKGPNKPKAQRKVLLKIPLVSIPEETES